VLHGLDTPNGFDLLSIDVEGPEVLLSINLNRYRPKLILIEMHGFDISNPDANKIHCRLVFDELQDGWISNRQSVCQERRRMIKYLKQLMFSLIGHRTAYRM